MAALILNAHSQSITVKKFRKKPAHEPYFCVLPSSATHTLYFIHEEKRYLGRETHLVRALNPRDHLSAFAANACKQCHTQVKFTQQNFERFVLEGRDNSLTLNLPHTTATGYVVTIEHANASVAIKLCCSRCSSSQAGHKDLTVVFKDNVPVAEISGTFRRLRLIAVGRFRVNLNLKACVVSTSFHVISSTPKPVQVRNYHSSATCSSSKPVQWLKLEHGIDSNGLACNIDLSLGSNETDAAPLSTTTTATTTTSSNRRQQQDRKWVLNKCCVCLIRLPNVCIQPCGHMVCSECGRTLSWTLQSCPHAGCHSRVLQIHKVILPICASATPPPSKRRRVQQVILLD